jgi:hypothetical protein
MVKGETKMGVQLDSLSDFLTFGVAPAILAYAWGLHEFGVLGLLVVFVFAAGAMLRLDVELFCAGLHDIIDRFPDQHIVNRLAAFCGMTMSGGNPKDTVRGRIQNCFGWITADHMRELHPAVWATAPVPSALQTPHPDNDAIRRGMSRALSALAECYSEHISTGHRLVFDGKGLSFVRAA